MARLFLDANVLFSAAYRPDARIGSLWDRSDVELVSSSYAVAEARANLSSSAQQHRLERLLSAVEVLAESTERRVLPEGVALPEKDRPILDAAIRGGAAYLVTGDLRHFGPYLGRSVCGVRITTPAELFEA